MLQNFRNRRPHPGERLSTYAQALLELLNKAIPNIGAEVSNELVRDQLTAHLPEYMKAIIRFNQSMSWDDLLKSLDAAQPYITGAHPSANASSDFGVHLICSAIWISSQSQWRLIRFLPEGACLAGSVMRARNQVTTV